MDGQRWKGFMQMAKDKLENFRRNFSIRSNSDLVRPKIISRKGENVPMGISSLQSGVLSYPRLLKSSSPKKRQEEITRKSVSLSLYDNLHNVTREGVLCDIPKKTTKNTQRPAECTGT